MNLMTNHPFEIFNLTGADLIIVLLMVVVFALAVALPRHGSRTRGRSGKG